MTRCAFEVVTIFPDVIDGFVGAGVLGRAIERGVVDVHATDIREFTSDKHRTVDDAPFGGGAGMVMKAAPVVDALESIEAKRGPMHRVMLTPSAPRFDQRAAERLSKLPRIALVCGRYEGIDERVRDHHIDECFSIGDYVLGGGEVAALVVIESVSRLVAGVMGNPDSAVSESFADAPDGETLEYPQYTRPAEFRGHGVPSVLLGGDHKAIAAWRGGAARRRTWALRPDLRPARSLPAKLPIWVAVESDAAGEISDWQQISDHYPLAGIAIVGESSEGQPLSRALANHPSAAGRARESRFKGIRTLRKHLKRTTGVAPWIVRLSTRHGTPDELAHEAHSLAELADVLHEPEVAEGRAMVLWVRDLGASSAEPVDAVYAPTPSNEGELDQQVRQGLAIKARIDEPRDPCRQPAVLADVALATLHRTATETRRLNERDEP